MEPEQKELCEYCGNPVKVNIFKGEGYCSQRCHNMLEGREEGDNGSKTKP